MNDDPPPRRWDLSAPESGVVLWGPETRAGDALKLALLELVVRRTLRLVSVNEHRLLLFSKTVNVLAPGASGPRPVDRALQGVLEVTPPSRSYVDGIVGAPIEHWARAVVARYQRRGGYVQAEVLPALEVRGIYRREQYRRLGLFEAHRWVLTPEGGAALAELKTLVESARESFRGGKSPDAALAADLFASMGAAVLLLPELFPEFRRLRHAYSQTERNQGRGDGGVETYSNSTGGRERFVEDEDRETGPEIDASDVFDFDALAGDFGPGLFDGLDAASDAIDAGVDSGGGDGGGDGDGE